MILTYAELEDFFAEIHRVAPEKRVALKGRLKHFQRLGWPAGTNKGKGARVQYGVGQTLSLAMGFELLQLGLTPERVVAQFKLGSNYLAKGFLEALNEYGPEPDEVYYIFSPESLANLRGDDCEDPGVASIMVSRSKLSEVMQIGPIFSNRRFAFVNMSSVLYDYMDFFVDKGLGDPQRLREPLENWRKVSQDAFDRWQAHILEGYPSGDT